MREWRCKLCGKLADDQDNPAKDLPGTYTATYEARKVDPMQGQDFSDLATKLGNLLGRSSDELVRLLSEGHTLTVLARAEHAKSYECWIQAKELHSQMASVVRELLTLSARRVRLLRMYHEEPQNEVMTNGKANEENDRDETPPLP